MQRQVLLPLAATLLVAPAGAFAQSGALSGVTMRVLDDLRDVEAVVLSLDASRGATEQGAEGARAPAAAADAGNAAEAEPERASRPVAEGERGAERRERDDLHDTDVDERSEGRLEDRDVEQRAVAAPAAP